MTERAILSIIDDDDDDRLIKLECEGIVEVEPDDCYWYSVRPNEQIIDTFGRFFQRLIWQRSGETGELIRDPETGLTTNLSGWATDLAHSYAEKICRNMDCADEFWMTAEAWLDEYASQAYIRKKGKGL